MNENEEIGCLYSWFTIIIALSIFWPIGVFLIIKRVSIDKKAAMNVGKILGYLSIASYVIAGLLLLTCLDDGYFASDDITSLFFFGIAGFVLQIVAQKLKKQATEIKRYLSIIVNGNENRIDTIAASMGKSYDAAKADIQNMINKGYFKNAYINDGTREIVFQGRNIQAQAEMAKNNTATSNKMRVVSCPCCGANNTIIGNVGESEYCGSPLH